MCDQFSKEYLSASHEVDHAVNHSTGSTIHICQQRRVIQLMENAATEEMQKQQLLVYTELQKLTATKLSMENFTMRIDYFRICCAIR